MDRRLVLSSQNSFSYHLLADTTAVGSKAPICGLSWSIALEEAARIWYVFYFPRSSVLRPTQLSYRICQMRPGKFREDYIAIVLRELLKGLDYLHGEGKLHRDIKGEFWSHIASFCAPFRVGGLISSGTKT